MVAFAENLVGTGLYTVEEAALYARIPPQTFRRWLFGGRDGEPVVRPEFEGQKFVSFTDFVQAVAVRNIRVQHKVPLQKIRDAVRRASDEFNIDYPLARKHTTYLFNGEIYIRTDTDSPLLQVSGRSHHQQALRVVETFLRDISFDPETGLASEYEAFRWSNEIIRMDPKIHFGEPFFSDTGYSPRVLYEAAQSEGSVEAAALAYGVDPSQVEVAFRFFDHLELRSAA